MFSKNEIVNRLDKLSEKLDNFVGYAKDRLEFIPKLVILVEAQGKQLEAQGKQLEALEAHLVDIEEVVNKIYSEMLRFTGDKTNMKLSVWAFCRLYDLSFSYGDLARMGRQATRESRRQGADIESVSDPRFGLVNVYEPEILELLFLEGDDKDLSVADECLVIDPSGIY